MSRVAKQMVQPVSAVFDMLKVVSEADAWPITDAIADFCYPARLAVVVICASMT
jgi:hypothetical protein